MLDLKVYPNTFHMCKCMPRRCHSKTRRHSVEDALVRDDRPRERVCNRRARDFTKTVSSNANVDSQHHQHIGGVINLPSAVCLSINKNSITNRWDVSVCWSIETWTRARASPRSTTRGHDHLGVIIYRKPLCSRDSRACVRGSFANGQRIVCARVNVRSRNY